MTISFNIPPAIGQAIARSDGDPAGQLKEARLVELYRQSQISHGQFAEGLEVPRSEANAAPSATTYRSRADLKCHASNVAEDLPIGEETWRTALPA